MIRSNTSKRGLIAPYLPFFIFLLFSCTRLYAESFRTNVEGRITVSLDRTMGDSVSVGINSAVLIDLAADPRFLRGVEIEITAPHAWLQFRNSLFKTIYSDVSPQTASGLTDLSGRNFAREPLPSRLRTIYQIPIRTGHGLRTTTTSTVTGTITPDSFPMLFRLMPIDKGLPAAFERLSFSVTARPILSGEGAVRIIPRYPPLLVGRPFTVLINDTVINDISEEIVLREGENHLVILSEDYRNESRRFIVKRASVIDLIIELQDPTPIIIFESPQNTRIFLNNVPVAENREPVKVEPGIHEVRFQVGDYTIVRSVNIQRGQTYRIAMEVDITVHEID